MPALDTRRGRGQLRRRFLPSPCANEGVLLPLTRARGWSDDFWKAAMKRLALAAILFLPHAALGQGLDQVKAHYTKYEYRIPMRDGKKLFTAVYVPKDQDQRYPILLTRTPYSCRALRRRSVPGQPRPVAAVRQGRLHLRLPGRARPLDVRRRLRQHAAAHPGEARPAGHRREHRHLRHHRLARQERRRTTTARSACRASPTPASTPRPA